MTRYIILGAGAIGSALGGALAKAGCGVTLVARTPHVEAIRRQGGLLLRTLAGTRLQPIEATISLSPSLVSKETVLFLTTKANDTEAAIADLRGIDTGIPVVCWQNGVEAEAVVKRFFSNVYGGVVRLTATMPVPGETMYAGNGTLLLGAYPQGTDSLSLRIALDLNRAGFSTRTCARIMEDKWLKVLVSCISCVKPMIFESDLASPARVALCRSLLQEAISVVQAAGITAASSNGTEDSPGQMLLDFKKTLALADGEGQGMVLQNSTWQSLARHKRVLENEWYTGVIVKLGLRFNVSTPCSQSVLFFLDYISKNSLGPQSISLDSIITKAHELGAPVQKRIV